MIIIDEFLTFVQNKIDVLDELSIVQICVSNFTDSEIETGKATLLKSLPERGNRNIARKGEDKNKKTVKDIIKLFKENDPTQQPVFVARNLNRLPPVSFDHVDVSRLLKDIAGMKTELQNIRSDAATKVEMTSIQTKISSDITSLRASITKMDHGISRKSLQSSKNNDENKIFTTPVRQRIQECTDKMPLRAPAPVTARSRSKSSDIHTPSYRDIVMPTARPRSTAAALLTTGTTKTNDGFTIVQNKKRRLKTNMCGTATGPSKIQVAELSSAVYISRLTKTTTIDDIKEHIQDMGETCRDVILLTQQKETEFNSYKVIIPKSKLSTYLSNTFWPEGVRYRLFREFIPKVNSRVTKQ